MYNNRFDILKLCLNQKGLVRNGIGIRSHSLPHRSPWHLSFPQQKYNTSVTSAIIYTPWKLCHTWCNFDAWDGVAGNLYYGFDGSERCCTLFNGLLCPVASPWYIPFQSKHLSASQNLVKVVMLCSSWYIPLHLLIMTTIIGRLCGCSSDDGFEGRFLGRDVVQESDVHV